MTVLQLELVPKLDHNVQDPWVTENWHMVAQEAYPEAISTWENHYLIAVATRKIIQLLWGISESIDNICEKVVFRTQCHSGVSGGVETMFWFWQTQWKQQPFIWRTVLVYAEPPWRSTNLLIWPEIRLVATKQLVTTFLTVGNNTCVHGECSYCRQIKPTCTDGDTVEGTVTLWLPGVWPEQTLIPIGQNLDKKQSSQVGMWWVLL